MLSCKKMVMEKSSSLPAIRTGARMDKSDLTQQNRYVYEIHTTYAVVADSDDNADIIFLTASEGGEFTDSIVIERQSISRTLELKDRGEKKWTWNQSLQKWDLTKYSLS